MKDLILIFLFVSLLFSGMAQGKTETVYLSIDGLDRYYELYIPHNYSSAKKYPIVFILHGGGGKAKGMVRFVGDRFSTLATCDSFIVVYPNGNEKGWNDGARDTLAAARRLNINDVGFFEAMIADLDAKLSIDKRNIFVCGISNGGFMAQRLAVELSGKIKGIAVVAANLSVHQWKKPKPTKLVSVLFICGTDDPLVPYHGGHVTVFRQKRGEVLSVSESIEFWKNVNACSVKTDVYLFPNKNKRDGSTAEKTTWQNLNYPEMKVINLKVKGGGHTWPGTKQYLPRSIVGNTNRDFNGCDEIWAFFKSLK